MPRNTPATANAMFQLGIDAASDRTGAAAVEFALILPALLMILMGILEFGLTLNNYLALIDGVRSGDRAFAISRSSPTPFTSTTTAVTNSAASLTAASITTTLKVNGTTCASDAACSAALAAAPGGAAYVQATYPCNLTVMSVNFAPGCTLFSATTDLIE